MFTRKSIADHLDAYDDQITELQDSKREMLNDYRQQLADKGFGKAAIKAEIDGLKVAMRRRRVIAKKGEEQVEQADAIADEIFLEITAASRAPRATREIIEKNPPATRSYAEEKGRAGRPVDLQDETDEITEQRHNPVPDAAAAGEQRDETGRAVASAPITHSQATSSQPADTAGEARPSSPVVSPATIPDPYDPGPIPAFLDRRQPKAREWETA